MSEIKYIESWDEIGILPRRDGEKHKCPNCNHQRNDKTDRSLSVTPSTGIAHCHYCEINYKIMSQHRGFEQKKKDLEDKVFDPELDKQNKDAIDFLIDRSISVSTIKRYKVKTNDEGIIFELIKNEKVVGIKYRPIKGLRKAVSKKGSDMFFYGAHTLNGDEKDLYITEGEIDALSFYEATKIPAVSLPNGANNIKNLVKRYWHFLDQFETIHLLFDKDSSGQKATQQFIDEVEGRKNVYTYHQNYPPDCKDINEIITDITYGKEEVNDVLKYPVKYKKQKDFFDFDINFPKGVFPSIVEAYMYEVSRVKTLPYELLAPNFIIALAYCCGDRFIIESPNRSMEIIPSVWFAMIGESGVGKTPAYKSMMKPLKDYDHEKVREFNKNMSSYISNANSPKEQRAEIDKPRDDSMIAQDVTEASLLAYLGRPESIGTLMYFDELNRLLKTSSKMKVNNTINETLMELWNGDSKRVMRKSSADILIEAQPAHLIGGIQPEIIKSMFTDESSGNGFVQRFMFCKSIEKQRYLSRRSIGKLAIKHTEVYETALTALNERLKDSNFRKKELIEFTDQASEKFFDWSDNLRDEMKEESSLVKSLVSKLEINCIKIAFYTQLADDWFNSARLPTMINLESTERALRIMDYFKYCAQFVIGFNMESQNFKILADRLSSQGKNWKDIINMLIEAGHPINGSKLSTFVNKTPKSVNQYIRTRKVR